MPRTLADLGAARQPLHVVDLDPPITQRHTVLAWKTGRPQPPAAEAFLTCAARWFADDTNAPPHTNHPTANDADHTTRRRAARRSAHRQRPG